MLGHTQILHMQLTNRSNRQWYISNRGPVTKEALSFQNLSMQIHDNTQQKEITPQFMINIKHFTAKGNNSRQLTCKYV